MKMNYITQTHYTHISGSDGLALSVLRIEPADPERVRGIVQIVHGKNEHKGRYAELMRFLAENGFITVCNDHRGHGESVPDPSGLGYFGRNGAKMLVDDLHEITLEIKEYAAELCGRDDLPFAMLGHSMGSLAARCYLRRFDSELDKLLLLGCPAKSYFALPGLVGIKLMKHIHGERSTSKLVHTFVMTIPYELRFYREKLRNSWTCTDREAVIEQNNDPLCAYSFTLNGYEEMAKLAILTYKGGHRAKNPDIPIRFLSGKDDPCAKSRARLAEAVQILQKAGYTNVRFKMYSNMRHNILHEKQKERVFRDILKILCQ